MTLAVSECWAAIRLHPCKHLCILGQRSAYTLDTHLHVLPVISFHKSHMAYVFITMEYTNITN